MNADSAMAQGVPGPDQRDLFMGNCLVDPIWLVDVNTYQFPKRTRQQKLEDVAKAQTTVTDLLQGKHGALAKPENLCSGYCSLAHSYEILGEYSKALNAWKTALQTRPRVLNSYTELSVDSYTLAVFAQVIGDDSLAEKGYVDAIEFAKLPMENPYWDRYGWEFLSAEKLAALYVKHGRYLEAEWIYREQESQNYAKNKVLDCIFPLSKARPDIIIEVTRDFFRRPDLLCTSFAATVLHAAGLRDAWKIWGRSYEPKPELASGGGL